MSASHNRWSPPTPEDPETKKEGGQREGRGGRGEERREGRGGRGERERKGGREGGRKRVGKNIQ